MKKYLLLLLAMALCLALCACGRQSDTVVPEVTPTATPVPTETPKPVVSFLGKEVPLSELEAGYTFELYGQTLNTVTTTEAHYLSTEIGDEGLDDFREVLPYMQNLTYLTFDRCDTTDEEMAKLRDEFRDSVKIAWRVFFGSNFTNMSDATTIWASCDIYNDEQAEPLKYFEDLINLDVGHGCFSDLSFLYGMPNLEILIVACNSNISDITPIGSLKHLKYLEIGETSVSDLSPLENCTELEHLNFGCDQLITDLTPLEGLTNLKRLCAFSLYNSALNMTEEEEKFQELLPDAYVDFGWYGSQAGAQIPGRWRYRNGVDGGGKVEKYAEICDIFDYDNTDGNIHRQTVSTLPYWENIYYGP